MRRFLLIAVLMLVAVSASAQKTASQRKAALEKEIELLDRQLKQNLSKTTSALSNLTLTRRKVTSRKALVAESDKELSALNDSIAEKQSKIDALQARLDTMGVFYSKLVRTAYKNRDARLWYMYILGSSSMGQASRRYAYLRNMSTQMNAQARRIREVQSELEEQKAAVESLRADARKVRDSRAADLSKLQKEEKDVQGLVNQLNRDKKKYQAQLSEKRRQVEALNRELNKAISSAVSSGKTSSKTSTQVDQKLSSEFAANKGKLPWPVSGVIVDHFGQHYHPVYKSVKLPFNNGVSVAVDPGTAVKAVFSGVVKQIIVMPGYNQCVLVQHGSYFTFYCKLGSVSVKSGDKVTTGQSIGVVDTIGGETQLHFQLWSGKTPQNPESWLK